MTIVDDGRIVVADAYAGIGGDDAAGALYVSRFTTDGTPDPGFGVDGVSIVASPMLLSENGDINVRPDGAISVTMPPLDSPGAVFARLNADGSPDASFGDGGMVFPDVAGWSYEWNTLPDGRTLGYDQSPRDVPGAFLRAYDKDGVADTSFGIDGLTGLPGMLSSIPQYAPAIRSGERIILGLYTNDWSIGDIGLVAITDDGAIDPTWGVQGRRLLADDPGVQGSFIALGNADNGDVLELHQSFPNSSYGTEAVQVVIDRFDADGMPKGEFGVGGRVVFRVGPDGAKLPEPIDAPVAEDPEVSVEVPTPDPQDSSPQGGSPPPTSPFSAQPIDEGVAAVLLLGTAAERSLFGESPDDVLLL
jgi:uncharacterized delta-60 repeat protein